MLVRMHHIKRHHHRRDRYINVIPGLLSRKRIEPTVPLVVSNIKVDDLFQRLRLCGLDSNITRYRSVRRIFVFRISCNVCSMSLIVGPYGNRTSVINPSYALVAYGESHSLPPKLSIPTASVFLPLDICDGQREVLKSQG